MTATNDIGLYVTQTINVNYTKENSPPTILMTPPSISMEDHETVSYTIDLTTIFDDEDTNQTIAYSHAAIPDYLSADIVGAQFSLAINSNGSQVRVIDINFL